MKAHYTINPDHLTDRVRRVFRAAGFVDAEKAKDEEEKTPPVARCSVNARTACGASLRDFHSFRVSRVTVALTAGVPLEIVRRVTDHRATDIVLNQPGRGDFRRTLASRLPALLGDRSAAREEEFNGVELRAKLTAMEDSTWRHIRDELLTHLPVEVHVTPSANALQHPSFAGSGNSACRF